MRAVEESMPCGYPLDAAAVLIAEVDGPLAGLAQQAERISAICRENGCREVRKAKDDTERDLLWAGRRGAFGAIARLSPNYLVADCTVPRTRLPEALERVGAIAERHRLAHGNVFHAGDGNLHPLLLFDARDADQVERVHVAATETMEACVALGGTITGEHGVGIEKVDAMRMIFSEADLDFQRALRAAFDPEDLINPGKILPPDIRVEDPGEPEDAGVPDAHELTPANVEDACDMVRCAVAARSALLPLGNGTHRDFGNYAEPAATPLRSAGLSAVVEYDAANQTVTIGSGMSLRALQEVLRDHSQWLPLRPPGSGERTAGGVTALGACGPERLRYGAPRDLLLGMKFVSGRGRLISAGGRVVKNVAGYDLTRLMAGSAGTLGFVTELTFRVASLPERCVALVAAGALGRCGAAATELLQSKLEPAFVFAAPAGPDIRLDDDGTWTLSVGFEGFGETVDAQLKGCEALLERSGLRAGGRPEYSALEGLCGRPCGLLAPSAFLVRADVPPDSVVEFVHAQQDILSEAGIVVDFGCGRVLAGMPSLTDGGWTRSCENAMNAKGHAILKKAPEDFKKQHDVFGPARPCRRVMHRIKAALDPCNVFAPGRLPGGK